MEPINDEKKLQEIIETLLESGEYELNEYHFKDEDIKYRYEILKLICGVKGEKEILRVHNLKNMQPINCLIQQRLLALFKNIESYSMEELITKYDSISSFFCSLKKEQKFLDYLKQKKYKAIPLFIMLGFCASINLGKDISQDIIELMKKNYIKVIIKNYINEMRKSLSNILFYYDKIVLHVYDDEENNYDLEISPNDLLYQDLKRSLERYMCFNELFDEGEIVNFANCLLKTISHDIKSIYLKKGPEIENINNIIKYIYREILDNFSSKNYYQKSNLNDLYDVIAYIVNTFSEDSYEENYAKFVVKYCSKYRQGNKNIVISFFSGLNPDNFKETFNNLDMKESNKEDYYTNIESLISQISSKKKKRKGKKVSSISANNSNNISTEIANNNIHDSINYSGDNSQTKNIINNTTQEIINPEIDNEIKGKESNSEENNDENKEKSNSELEKLKKEIEIIMKKNNQKMEEAMNSKVKAIMEENKQMNLKVKAIMEENEQMKAKYDKIIKENIKIKEQLTKYKEKSLNSQLQMKIDLFKLKNEMRQISYRDISKPIINNYIEKYESQLKKEDNLKNKKDKAQKIVKYLNGEELNYYGKLVEKYYASNENSHMSKIFKMFGKNYIVGLEQNKIVIVDKIFTDYCRIIFEVDKDPNATSNIDKLFGVKKIVGQLYDAQNIYQ